MGGAWMVTGVGWADDERVWANKKIIVAKH